MIRVATKDDAAGMLEIYAPFILNSGITQETDVPSVEDFQKRAKSFVNKKYPIPNLENFYPFIQILSKIIILIHF